MIMQDMFQDQETTNTMQIFYMKNILNFHLVKKSEGIQRHIKRQDQDNMNIKDLLEKKHQK